MVKHALVVALIAVTGCQPMAEFEPATDTGLPDAGTPDAGTPDTSPPDASPPGGEVLACFGTQLLKICVTPSSLTAVAISMPLTINTDNVDMCTAIGKYCVIAATTLTINAALRATGTKPLVLLASDSILVNQLIDVGSHRSPTEFIGAGADPVTCLAGALPGTTSGGAGGSFAGTGGSGGAGGGGGAGGLPASATPISALRGGCRGQDGDGPGKGVGGHGGGAVYLIAGNRISITGPGINAAGEGGTGGVVIANVMSGGGGGGAGGMIGLDAPIITGTGLILANGGGGGQGSGTINPGLIGFDPAGINAASGGSSTLGGSGCGGDGGNGSSGIVGGPGASGGAFHQCGPPGGGGGGGGGAAGIIKAPATANLGTQLSPAATH